MSSKSKPQLENVAPDFGTSFSVKKFIQKNVDIEPFWHMHPELELIYVKGGNGKRHIGKHLSFFRNGELMLIGANLPHFGFTDRLTGNESETVIQFRKDFLGPTFFELPEMLPIKKMFDNAERGIVFSGETKKKIGPKLEQLIQEAPYKRLSGFLRILHELAESKSYRLLNVQDCVIRDEKKEDDRIKDVYKFVRKGFQGPLKLNEIAAQTEMTVPAFCRYFKNQSGKTFTQFVNEYRIIHACKLLAESTIPVSEVAAESGFQNFSHFNKQFNKVTGKTATAYRNEFKQLIN